MKAIKVVTISILVVVSMNLSAQIKVNSLGKVGINNSNPQFNIDAYGDYYLRTNNTAFGYNFGIKIDNSVSYSGSGEAPTLYPIGPGTLGKSNAKWYAAHIQNLYSGSDERFKTNIVDIEPTLSKLKNVRVVKYDLSQGYFDKMEGSAGYKLTGESEKGIGFLAQQLDDFFPELVQHDEKNDIYSVNYLAMIPLLVEALKEQQTIIEAQSLKLKEIEKSLEDMKNGVDESLKSGSLSSVNEELTTITNAFLYQNTPNPFTYDTEIRYFVPSEAKSASIYIFNLQGTLLKSEKCSTSGLGSIRVNGSELSPGMYIYSLVVDGVEVDSKRMILI